MVDVGAMFDVGSVLAVGTVFVVDDDDSIRSLLADYLKKNGYDVVVADSGEQFLERFS